MKKLILFSLSISFGVTSVYAQLPRYRDPMSESRPRVLNKMETPMTPRGVGNKHLFISADKPTFFEGSAKKLTPTQRKALLSYVATLRSEYGYQFALSKGNRVATSQETKLRQVVDLATGKSTGEIYFQFDDKEKVTLVRTVTVSGAGSYTYKHLASIADPTKQPIKITRTRFHTRIQGHTSQLNTQQKSNLKAYASNQIKQLRKDQLTAPTPGAKKEIDTKLDDAFLLLGALDGHFSGYVSFNVDNRTTQILKAEPIVLQKNTFKPGDSLTLEPPKASSKNRLNVIQDRSEIGFLTTEPTGIEGAKGVIRLSVASGWGFLGGDFLNALADGKGKDLLKVDVIKLKNDGQIAQKFTMKPSVVTIEPVKAIDGPNKGKVVDAKIVFEPDRILRLYKVRLDSPNTIFHIRAEQSEKIGGDYVFDFGMTKGRVQHLNTWKEVEGGNDELTNTRVFLPGGLHRDPLTVKMTAIHQIPKTPQERVSPVLKLKQVEMVTPQEIRQKLEKKEEMNVVIQFRSNNKVIGAVATKIQSSQRDSITLYQDLFSKQTINARDITDIRIHEYGGRFNQIQYELNLTTHKDANPYNYLFFFDSDLLK